MAITKTLTINRLRLSIPITGTLMVDIYYKKITDADYTLLASDVMVTPNETYPTIGDLPGSPPISVDIDVNTTYIFEGINELCGSVFTDTFYYPCAGSCPPGWTISDDGTMCIGTQTVPAIPPEGGTPETSVAVNFTSYSTCGSYIFDSGFNVNGTGTATKIDASNPFWVNGDGSCADATTTDGPLNRSALWVSDPQNDQEIGFSVCFDEDEESTKYIGVGADNYAIIQINGVTILQQDPAALDVQFPFAGTNSVPFKLFLIYPVDVPAGPVVVQVTGFNTSSVGAIGFEIYNNTAAEIAAATSYSDLDLVFSTKDFIGQDIQYGTQGAGYSCPVNYSLQSCGSPYVCVGTTSQPVDC